MSARTVRYYVQRGLVPAPEFRGKDTAYGEEHLVRLRAVRRLQEAYYPLDAIAAELDACGVEAIERIAAGKGIAEPDVRLRELQGRGDRVRASDAPTREAAPEREANKGGDRRIALFPGVDLAVEADAPAESVRLVEQLLAVLEAMSKVRQGGRER